MDIKKVILAVALLLVVSGLAAFYFFGIVPWKTAPASSDDPTTGTDRDAQVIENPAGSMKVDIYPGMIAEGVPFNENAKAEPEHWAYAAPVWRLPVVTPYYIPEQGAERQRVYGLFKVTAPGRYTFGASCNVVVRVNGKTILTNSTDKITTGWADLSNGYYDLELWMRRVKDAACLPKVTVGLPGKPLDEYVAEYCWHRAGIIEDTNIEYTERQAPRANMLSDEEAIKAYTKDMLKDMEAK